MSLFFLVLLPIQAQSQTFEWLQQFGTDRDVQGNAVAAGVSGIYVGGSARGVFPGQSSADANDKDAFVARYDTAGNQLWVRQFASTPFPRTPSRGGCGFDPRLRGGVDGRHTARQEQQRKH